MNEDVNVMLLKADFQFRALGGHGFKGDDDVAEFDFRHFRQGVEKVVVVNVGKGKHVGRLVKIAELAVEGLYFFVAAEFDIEADFFFALQKFRFQSVNDGLKNVFRNGCRVGQPVVPVFVADVEVKRRFHLFSFLPDDISVHMRGRSWRPDRGGRRRRR